MEFVEKVKYLNPFTTHFPYFIFCNFRNVRNVDKSEGIKLRNFYFSYDSTPFFVTEATVNTEILFHIEESNSLENFFIL